MNEKTRLLISLMMYEDFPKTAQYFADAMGISPRSIKNYIKEINSFQNYTISSSNRGYLLNKRMAENILTQNEDSIPQSYNERATFIIKSLLFNNKSQVINIFDLCDELHVSFSTVKSDISKMNKTFQHFDVSFYSQKNELKISGKELNKRKLMSHIIYEDTDSNFSNIEYLYDYFEKRMIDSLSIIINKTLKKYQYYINDFSFMNLLLHLTVLIDRVIAGESNSKSQYNYLEIDTSNPVISDLCFEIENEFNITLRENEKIDISFLIQTDATITLSKIDTSFVELVGEDLYAYTLDILTKVKKIYQIDLFDDTFIVPFCLHIKKLIIRSKNNKMNRNPMTNMLKRKSPLIYDIAVLISLKFSEHYSIHIEEDEIAYIALHVGAEVERQKKKLEKVECVICCPNYLDMSENIKHFLLENFDADINIITFVNYPHQLNSFKFQLVITTYEIESTKDFESVVISPINMERAKNEIDLVLDKLKNQSKIKFLQNNFNSFFESQTFFYTKENLTKEEVLQLLCTRLVDLTYVHPSFHENVLEREKMSSTSFGNIAIPHSVNMNAIKTNISILVSEKGINWDGSIVNIVFLTSINEIDKRHFRIIYEAILELIERKDIHLISKEITTFEKFKSFMFSEI